jgi:glycosyltransferase involved in cell wall biosynthesis
LLPGISINIVTTNPLRKIRVLEISATLKPAGAENVVLSLATQMDRSKFEVAVVSLYDPFPCGLEPQLLDQGVPVWHLGKHRGPDLRIYGRLRRVVQQFQPDVIHSHCYVTRYTLGIEAPVMVHTVHNLAKTEVGVVGRIFHRYAFQRAVRPVAVGGAVADSIRRLYGSPPFAIIPNGIDVQRYWRPEARQQWRQANGFRSDDLLVVSVGRLEPQKNPVALAHAIARVPNAHLLFVGQGKLRAKLAGRERVHLLGVRADIPEVLASADVFALASNWEGLPLAVLEAMAAGLPVAATRVGCIPEVVEDGRTGFLVPPGNEEALASALHRLATDANLRKQLGAAARARSMSFAVDRMVAAYESLFTQLLSRSTTPQPGMALVEAT